MTKIQNLKRLDVVIWNLALICYLNFVIWCFKACFFKNLGFHMSAIGENEKDHI